MPRLAKILVSLCGSLGIATTLTFFLGIYLSFLPEWYAWKEFFVPNALWLMAIPYILLMLYMFLRSALGLWLFERGHIEHASQYTATRMTPNLLRSRREALNNRLIQLKILAPKGDYPAARALLSDIPPKKLPQNARAVLSLANWQMEIALRLDEYEIIEVQFNAIQNILKPAPLHAQALAIRAELALRQDEKDLYEELITNAFWADASNKRAQLTRALATLTFAHEPEQFQQAAQLLELVRTQDCGDIPLRAAELCALQALALYKNNQIPQALQTLETASQLPADAWARKVIDSVSTRLAPRESQT